MYFKKNMNHELWAEFDELWLWDTSNKLWDTSYELRDTRYKLPAKIWDTKSRLHRLVTVRYGTWNVEWLYRCRIVQYIDWTQLSRMICANWSLYIWSRYCVVRSSADVTRFRFLSSLYGRHRLLDFVNSPGEFNLTFVTTRKPTFYFSRNGVPLK
jgi:hypothetical protein